MRMPNNLKNIKCPSCGSKVTRIMLKETQSLTNGSVVQCDNCKCILNSAYRGFQNFMVKEQKLSVKLTPCDDSFKLQTDQEIEVVNQYVSKLEFKLTTYGFEGELAFNLPIQHYVTSLFDFIKERNPIQITISFEQTMVNNQQSAQSFELTGFIESSGNSSIAQNFYGFNDFSVTDDGNYSEMSTYRTSFLFKFVDPLKYFFSKHALFGITLNTTYSSLLSQHVTDCKASDHITISVDDSFTELTSNRDFIALPFQEYGSEDNLYSFWLHTIRLYGGYLVYKDKKYQILSSVTVDTYEYDDIHRYDKSFINNICFRHCNRYNTGLKTFNGIYTGTSTQEVKTNNSQQSEAVFSCSELTRQRINSLFNLEANKQKTALENDFSREYCVELSFNGLPFFIDVTTYKQIKLKSSQWLSIFGSTDLDLTAVEIFVSMERSFDAKPFDDLRTKSDLDDTKLKNELSQEDVTATFEPFMEITAQVTAENSESKHAYFPEYKVPLYPVVLEGTVVVSDSSLKKYTGDSKVPYMIYDGSSDNTGDETTNQEGSSSSSSEFTLARKPEHWLAYHIAIPVLKSGEDDFVIPVPYVPNIRSDQHFAPYQYNQPVLVQVFQEDAILEGLADYTTFTEIDKDKQVNQYVFGPEKQGMMSFEASDDDEKFLLQKTESKNKTTKSILMTNDSFTISFSEDEE
ncbi:hypothetical protein P0136_04415 [Lentisphaerota bacterium ZTH]|nr:hypothetical protein JYG24_04465 [Lentisphaerota bacterium]WET07238.1 hypothetical protein P0136_04415 [Lentisphaerota bacterium ZTH]